MLGRCLTTMAVLIGTTMASDTARAAMITFEFGGVVTSVQDPTGALDGGVEVADEFFGTFTFDSETPDSLPGDPTVGNYRFANALMTLSIGSLVVDSASEQNHGITVENNWLGFSDSFSMGSWGFDSGGLWVAELYLQATDWTMVALDDDTLPTSPDDLAGFSAKELVFVGQGGFNVHGSITSFTPEPSAILLLVFGAVMIFRRKQS